MPRFLPLVGSLGLMALPDLAAAHDIHVAAALQPTFSIASALAEGTEIEVRAVPASLPGMGGLDRAFKRPDATTVYGLQWADAVVTIGGVWPEDPLFTQARARNINVIEIDASRSLDVSGESVAQVATPQDSAPWRQPAPAATRGVSPYAWLSPTNGIRMAEIVAADFVRLSPEDEARIVANLAAFATRMQQLQASYEDRLLGAGGARIFALSDHFSYLTGAFGLFVEGSFTEQDVRWNEADFEGFRRVLVDQGITHVIHHWQPSEAIAQAIEAGGARLVVLDDGQKGAGAESPDPEGYQKTLRADLDALTQALIPPAN